MDGVGSQKRFASNKLLNNRSIKTQGTLTFHPQCFELWMFRAAQPSSKNLAVDAQELPCTGKKTRGVKVMMQGVVRKCSGGQNKVAGVQRTDARMNKQELQRLNT